MSRRDSGAAAVERPVGEVPGAMDGSGRSFDIGHEAPADWPRSASTVLALAVLTQSSLAVASSKCRYGRVAFTTRRLRTTGERW